jgi:hypothetical protein
VSECSRLDELLLAEPEELSAGARAPLGEHPLGLHLCSCDRCAAAARRILDATAALDAALSRAGSEAAPDLDAITARAGVGGSAQPPARRRRTWKLAAVLAAAGIVGLVLLPEWDPTFPGVPLEPQATAPAAIDAPSGEYVAVIATDNPDITVLWFFEGGSR